MIKPDPRVYRAMTYLPAAELAPFLEYLHACRQDAMERLSMSADPGAMMRIQGEAQFLKQLLDHVKNAPAQLQTRKQ